MDWADAQRRKITDKASGLYEVIRTTTTGYDQRDQVSFTKTERLGVYSSEIAALRSVLPKDVTIRPLEIDG